MMHLFHSDRKYYCIINCHCMYIHSILYHRLLVWRMELFILIIVSFKVRSVCRQLNSHVSYDIQSVTIFRYCCRILWKSSFAAKLWEMGEFLSTAHLCSISYSVLFGISNVQIQIVLLALTCLLICQVATRKQSGF